MGEWSYHSHITDSTEHSTVTGLVGWMDTVGGVVDNSRTWCSHTLKAKHGQTVAIRICGIYTAYYIPKAHIPIFVSTAIVG